MTEPGGAAEPCLVCAGPVRFHTATWHRDPDRRVYLNMCRICGFVRVVDNPWDYAERGFSHNSTSGPRVGTDQRPGREFHMAMLGLDLLDRPAARVLILGAGLSRDWSHITNDDRVAAVTTSDLENFNDSPNFLELHEQGTREFDLVIACEVLEHLPNPSVDFAQVFSNLSDEGVFVASTNIYDFSPIDRHWYPYIPGHVSYHSARSIEILAAAAGMKVDFRVPLVATQRAGRRKRYVIFSTREDVMSAAARWFATEWYAPSEIDKRKH